MLASYNSPVFITEMLGQRFFYGACHYLSPQKVLRHCLPALISTSILSQKCAVKTTLGWLGCYIVNTHMELFYLQLAHVPIKYK